MTKDELIVRVGEAYGAVYELGDYALDILTDQPNYFKWLDAGHGDDYLQQQDVAELELILEDCERVVMAMEDYAL